MDTLRRSRIELEVRVKELESRVEELEEESGRKDEYVEKQRVKVAKYKAPSFCRSLRVDIHYKVVITSWKPQGRPPNARTDPAEV